jgi:hypothetical protein
MSLEDFDLELHDKQPTMARSVHYMVYFHEGAYRYDHVRDITLLGTDRNPERHYYFAAFTRGIDAIRYCDRENERMRQSGASC